jgi:hypothetical protein
MSKKEKNITSDRTPEELLGAIQNGELGDLLGRVKEAQSKIQEMRSNQSDTEKDSEIEDATLHPKDIAEINSMIIRDLIDLSGFDLGDHFEAMIKAVLTAAVAQYGRMLNADMPEKAPE